LRRFPGLKEVPSGERAVYNALFVLEHFLRLPRALAERKRLARERVARALRAQGPARTFPVQRVAALAPEEFKRRFLSTGTPVIIERAAASWPLASRWSFDEFRRRFGGETIKLVQREGLTDDDFVFDREYSEEIAFGDFLEQVLSGGRKYMRFSPLLERFPELLGDFDHDYFRRMVPTRVGLIYQVFIGGTGTATPLHNALSPFLFVNVAGIKRWTFIPNRFLPVLNPASDGVGYNHSSADLENPDESAHPGLAHVDRLEARLGPGDVMYVPSWLWHSVRNEAPTIGVRCGFSHLGNIVGESSTLAFTRVFGARNPTMLEALYHMLIVKNLPSREKRLLNPGLIRR
jgi:hypothetical protein